MRNSPAAACPSPRTGINQLEDGFHAVALALARDHGPKPVQAGAVYLFGLNRV
jgi:hypothetical protein